MGADQPAPQPKTSDGELLQRTLTLTSLAMLKVDIDERHRNYIDYLVTFALSVLATHKPEVVTDTLVADLLEKEFGLRIPVKAVQHVLRRLARAGHLRKEHEAFFPAPSLPQVDLSPKRADAANCIQRVYDALCKFAPTMQESLVWTDSEAASVIIGFLGRFAVDCLKTYVFNTALPRVPETGPKEQYVVSRFLQHAYDHERPLFEDFIVLVKGQMYANALTCPDLQSLEQKFDRVTFFLDTPVVLNLLGLQGQGPMQAAEELTTLVRDLRGSLAVLSHTLEEIKGVIRYAAQHLEDPQATSRVLQEVRNSGTTLSDLLLCLDQLNERLSACHIGVRSTPPYEKSPQIDEQAFQGALEDEVRYHANHALLNDINSVRSIYVLRRGTEPARLEDSVATLVTSNAAFARVAYQFGKTHNSTREVSSVITDYSLANVAWLKAPMKRPFLPEKETLALCYAALEPSKELFKKYVETMGRLITSGQISEEDHAILRLSPVAHRELMDFTLGDEAALTGAGIRQILDRVKESLVEEQRRLFAGEQARIEQQHADVTSTYEKREQDLRVSLDRQHDQYRMGEEERARLMKGLLTASSRARSLSRAFTILLMALFSGVLLLGAAAGSGVLTAQTLDSAIFRTLVPLFVLVAVMWGWYSWLTGKTVRGLTEQLEHRVTLKVFSWLTGQQEPPAT